MAHTTSDEIAEALAQQGLTEAQRHILELRLIARGEELATFELEGKLKEKLPWHVDTIAGKKVPASFRKPLIHTGIVPSSIRELSNYAAGGERFVVLELEGSASDVKVFRDTLLERRKTPHGGLDLKLHGRTIIRDLIEVGGSAFGFVRKIAGAGDNGEGGRPVYSWKRYPIEWLEPVHFVTRNTPRARQLAKEVSELEGGLAIVDISDDDGLPIFRAPEDALDDDLLFMRYEFEHKRSKPSRMPGGTATDEERIRSRKDFTVDAVITYRDLVVEGGALEPGNWELAKPIDPHMWGIVPIAVAKADGAEDWELSGEGLVEGPVESMAPVADRSASFLAESAWTAGDPTIVRLDVRDIEREIALEADESPDFDLVGAGDKILDLKSLRDKDGSVSLLEVDSDGLEALQQQSKDINRDIDRALGSPGSDPDKMPSVLSGVALTILNAPMVAQVETLRGFAFRGIAELVRKLEVASKADGMTQGDVVLAGHQWPRVFPFTANDQKTTGEAIGVLKTNEVISQETGVAMAAAVVGTDDPEAEAKQIEKEKDKDMDRALEFTPPLNGEEEDDDDEGEEVDLDDEGGGDNPFDTTP